MYGHQNVHTSRDPPADPTFRCDGCRVGIPIELIAKVAAGYVYCQTCSVPDRLPTPTRVDFPALDPESLPSCARCGDPQIRLVEDPVFGAEVEVCRDCYHEHGDPTDNRIVTTDLATMHALGEDQRVSGGRTGVDSLGGVCRPRKRSEGFQFRPVQQSVRCIVQDLARLSRSPSPPSVAVAG